MSILNDFCNSDLNIISLKHMADRRESLSDHVKESETGLKFIDATYGAEMYDINVKLIPGWQGLRDTVIKIINEAIENKTEILSICEDDFRLVDGWELQFEQGVNELPEDWSVLHLGGIDGKWCSRQYSGNLLKVRDGLMMHFIYLKKSILKPWLDKMIEKPNLTPDVALSEVYSDMDKYKAFRIDISYQDPKMGSDCIVKEVTK